MLELPLDQAAINREMVAWTEREITRFLFRSMLFQRRGLPEDEAELLADFLALRDQRRDDRRMCIECANLQRAGTCFAAANGHMPEVDRRWQPVRTLLMRCNHFKWTTPNGNTSTTSSHDPEALRDPS